MQFERLARSMTNHLSAQDAARLIHDASLYEDALARRTEGVTWMMWGLVTPAIFLTYAYAEAAQLPGGWWWHLLWTPWVFAGVVTTMTLWRSAALERPALRHDGGIPYVVRVGAFVLIVAAAMAFFPQDAPAQPLVVLGLAWAAMGLLNVMCMSAFGRGLALAAGLSAASAGIALAAFDAGATASLLVATAVTAALPLAGGLYQSLRG